MNRLLTVSLAFLVSASATLASARNSYGYGYGYGYGNGYGNGYGGGYTDPYDPSTPVYQDEFVGHVCFLSPSGEFGFRATAAGNGDWQPSYYSARNASVNACAGAGRDWNFCNSNVTCEREYKTNLISGYE